MILIDYSQIVVANYMIAVKDSSSIQANSHIVKYMVLNSIRLLNSKFKKKYGKIVLCVDGYPSWRREIFPYYKASRRDTKTKDIVDWQHVNEMKDVIKKDLAEYFPYKIIETAGAEGDDVIGVLAKKSIVTGEPCLIVSGDKDFIQLQKHNSIVQQYDKIRDRWLSDNDPNRYLFEHIIKGDRGDGIPNIFSPSDCLVVKIRQTPVTKKKIQHLWENRNELKTNERFVTNLKLIDLSFTPEDIQKDIMKNYSNYVPKGVGGIWSYLVKSKLTTLVDKVNEF